MATSARLQQLLTLQKESPEEPFILFALAKEYEKLANEEQALHYYELLRREHSSYVGTYYHLAKLLEKQNEPARAFNIYTEGMDIARQAGDQHALGELAGARLQLGDEEDFI